MDNKQIKPVIVSVYVYGAERIEALDRLRDADHSSRSAIFNKGLDLLIKEQLAVKDA